MACQSGACSFPVLGRHIANRNGAYSKTRRSGRRVERVRSNLTRSERDGEADDRPVLGHVILELRNRIVVLVILVEGPITDAERRGNVENHRAVTQIDLAVGTEL